MDLIEKSEVMAILDTSARSVERYLQLGVLVPVEHRKPDRGGRKIPLFDRALVEQLRDKQNAPKPIPDKPPKTKPPAALARVGRGGMDELVDAIAAGVARATALDRPLVVSVKAAAQKSGIPERKLREAIRDGLIPFARIGHGVKLRPEDVLTYRDSLFKSR